ncbi:cytochrome c biogenesis protein CcsA [Natrarchaeobaculum sulfurireducens]|uniref:Cytochrome c biogenesis factor n=1 Tax=Natrarchaeobaculum sulfurireducens TaxID=2044521 RepID=A0A346PD48_9EURY|nr:cytochrome c biogenesis protein CcsA [Natrarchaeobaculum sulfurireducens]AXR77443.1 Cytochrome c biogenesis factor [Natrarchaeobaculum sulfurireducens]AXR82586.1 Cytochrome c heme lyase subunit CcmF [Natrarchaeobaculum sulfurireducens]
MIPDALTFGTLLIVVAAFASGLSAALLLYGYLTRSDEFQRLTLVASGVSTAALVAAHSYLTYLFVVGDYTYAYVWENSAEYLSLLYRVTGVYANHEGSILFWATLTAVVATWTVYSSHFEGRGSRLVQSISLAIVATFAAMLTTQSPFTPIDVAYPDTPAGFVPPDGDGLNPLLIDPWMAIHPPITFAAYALLIVPFALGIVHFVSRFRGEASVFDEWLPSMLQWLRISWLLLTASIVFGGIWAYGVLGWGGFWSWDPVETAVLIPWLGLTAALHAANRYETSGEYSIFAPAAAALIFPLVIFATTVVRSGVFRSVHSFAAGGIGTGILFLLAVTGTLAIVLPFAYWFLEAGDPDRPADEPWLSRRTVYHGAVLSFAVLAFISIWGLSFPVLRNAATGVEVSVGQDHYNLWSYPVVVFMLLAGGLYALLDMRRRRLAIGATAAVAVVTIAAAFVTPSANWFLSDPSAHDPAVYRIVGNASVLSIVPPAVFFAVTWTVRYVDRVRGVPSRAFKLRETGIVLIHVGGAVLIVAVSFVYLFSTSASVAVVGVADATDNPEPIVEEVPDSEYTVEVTNYDSVEEPTIQDAARSPAEMLAVSEEVSLVRGEITEIDTIENTDVARLDDSDVWLASSDASTSFEEGTEVIARGNVFDGESLATDADAYVYTDADNKGTVSDPPEDVHEPRMVSHEVDITVYEGDEKVAEGSIAEQEYLRSEMNTNDALIERGITGDTYVVGQVSEGGASITIDTYPLANQIWTGVGLMLVGITALIVGDSRFRKR